MTYLSYCIQNKVIIIVILVITTIIIIAIIKKTVVLFFFGFINIYSDVMRTIQCVHPMLLA